MNADSENFAENLLVWVDFIGTPFFSMLQTIVQVKLVQYVWVLFLAGMFGMATLPIRPLFGALFVLDLVVLPYVGFLKKDKVKSKMPGTTRQFAMLSSWLIMFAVAWFFSKVL